MYCEIQLLQKVCWQFAVMQKTGVSSAKQTWQVPVPLFTSAVLISPHSCWMCSRVVSAEATGGAGAALAPDEEPPPDEQTPESVPWQETNRHFCHAWHLLGHVTTLEPGALSSS